MKYIIAVIVVFMLVDIGQAEMHKAIDLRTPTTASQKLEIDGLSGSNITFTSWSKNEIYINLHVSIESSSDDYERDYIQNVKLSQMSENGVLRIRLEEPAISNGSGSSILNIFKHFYVRKDISGEIFVPQSNPFSTDMRYGSLTLENMKGDLQLLGTSNTLKLKNCSSISQIDNNYGKTWISGSGGSLRLSGTSSTITISDFTGSLDLDADYSTVTLDHISNGVEIEDKSGKVSIDHVHGDTKVDADYSAITLSTIEGFVDVRSTSGTISARFVDAINVKANYSNIDISNVKGIAGKILYIKGQSGKLTLQDIVSDVQIDNPYSPMNLLRIRGNIEMMTTSSTITADEITGDWISHTQYSTLDVRGLTAKKILASNSSNPIEFVVKSVPNSIDIKNQYGSVKIKMPEGFSGSIDLSAEYGNITTTLPVKVKTMSSSAYSVGKVGSGSETITIETKSGNITLEER